MLPALPSYRSLDELVIACEFDGLLSRPLHQRTSAGSCGLSIPTNRRQVQRAAVTRPRPGRVTAVASLRVATTRIVHGMIDLRDVQRRPSHTVNEDRAARSAILAIVANAWARFPSLVMLRATVSAS